uniref:DNA-binding protein H-NS-like C-terminal domain-containing protein n=1 Tax=Enterovibrio norvegicus TaxID=188144 RepID=A0A0H4A0U7_9GAMM|nr:hypothetical protein [Enterovibrio norvegicus]
MKKIKKPEKICLVLQDYTVEELRTFRNELDRFLDLNEKKINEADNKLERLKIFLAHNDINSNLIFSDTLFKRKPKYLYINLDGEQKTWAGVGRMPHDLQRLLDEGNDIEKYNIKNIPEFNE